MEAVGLPRKFRLFRLIQIQVANALGPSHIPYGTVKVVVDTIMVGFAVLASCTVLGGLLACTKAGSFLRAPSNNNPCPSAASINASENPVPKTNAVERLQDHRCDPPGSGKWNVVVKKCWDDGVAHVIVLAIGGEPGG